MKVAVINFSGNVGKSTVSKYLLQPRIAGAKLIAIETINADEGDGEAVKGREFGVLQEDLMMHDAAVVDIGASNVEEVFKLMRAYKGSHEDFDLFVVPTTREPKQAKDTVGTIQALADLGVEPNRIRVVLNRTEPDEDLEAAFSQVTDYARKCGTCVVDGRAALHDNELYHRLRNLGQTVESMLADETDYRALLRAATDPDEKHRCAQMISLRRLALSAKDNLDQVAAAVLGHG
ncbi:MAG: StbB family protein [Rubrivivax sp.]|nr:StbB family protein [Rubrivivax sp.]